MLLHLLDRVEQLKRERAVLCVALESETHEVLRCASACTSLQRQQASKILDAQWGGGVKRRLRSLDDAEAHLWLVRSTGRCVGHARLGATAVSDRDDAAGGRCAIVTSVVVEGTFRGAGRGSRLMRALHDLASVAGYAYVYLWTDAAAPFYARLGYCETEGASADTAALRKLPTRSLSALEGLLASKAAAATAMAAASVVAAGLTGTPLSKDERCEGEEVMGGRMVHMRKRLLEELPLRAAPAKEELLGALRQAAARADQTLPLSGDVWRACIVQVAMAAQVGPTCGLAALRMAAQAHATAGGGRPTGTAAHGCGGSFAAPSLLTVAQERRYSVDGEIFDVGHLCALARDVCGLDAEVVAWPDASSLAAALAAGHLFVAPYDRGDANYGAPVCRGGARAHYALLVGCAWRDSSSGGGGGVTATSVVQSTVPDPGKAVGSELVLIGQHGMSTRPVAASFEEWRVSNAQLTAARSGFVNHGAVADDGPRLAGKCVLVRHCRCPESIELN